MGIKGALLVGSPREAWLEVRQPGDSGPGLLVRGAEGAEDAEQLVDLAVAREQGALIDLRERDRERETKRKAY